MFKASFPDVVSCPADFASTGLPSNAQSYLAITRGALASANDAGFTDAKTYLAEVIAGLEKAGADFQSDPQWAIVGR